MFFSLHTMFFSPYWVYDPQGVPYWSILKPVYMNDVNENKSENKSDSKSENKSDSKSENKSDDKKYRIRIGKWEEVYDAVDGTKTWYNTVTRKTTKKDPFW